MKEGEFFSREPPGELENDEKAFIGGSVVNTLTGLVKFGFSVATLGKLGNDETGNRVENKLKKYGIKFGTCREDLNHLNTATCDGSWLLDKA